MIFEEAANGKYRRAVHLPTHNTHFYDVHRLEFNDFMDIKTENSCHVLSLVEGKSVIVETANGGRSKFHYAETFVIPAAVESYRLVSPTGKDMMVVKTFVKPVSQWVALGLEEDPVAGYILGLPLPDHAHFPPRALDDIARIDASEDAMAAQLQAIDPDALTTADLKLDHALLTERLAVQKGLRVCRTELWDVNHMGGWVMTLAQYARLQPVETAAERDQALQRWSALPAFVDQEIANLRRGLSLGYSAPQSVVRRVISQVDGLATARFDASPLADPAKRSEDAAFKAAFHGPLAASNWLSPVPCSLFPVPCSLFPVPCSLSREQADPPA